ncbi:hypothetical protein [Actinoallomurus rhizosphaericola]|uniref:hypothetical protein n=1 Tax=Actinoallomurus rhizosphaericola TaxID=2952536 RepID=UPI002093367F|nr:hypothetical protein [Actinoallomurus rhizosphaericola]MCO5995442.1 hypothetical protein [Actinoallomurus rhizosphaericola]
MLRRTARRNRIGLAIIGLILFLGGLTAFIRGLGLYPGVLGAARRPVTDRAARAFVDGHVWFWAALAAVAIVIGVAALHWLITQAATGVQRTIRLEDDPREGITALPARVAGDAVRNDLLDSPDVRGATATFTGTPAHPCLRLTMTLEPNADPAGVEDLIRPALGRLRQSIQAPDLPAIVRIRTGR